MGSRIAFKRERLIKVEWCEKFVCERSLENIYILVFLFLV